MNSKKRKVVDALCSIGVLIVLIGIWQAVVVIFKIAPYTLPSPFRVLQAFVANFRAMLWPCILQSVKVIVVGFIIGAPIGILLATLMSQIDVLNKALSPYIIIVVCTPLISLVPLLMLSLGYGSNVRIIAVVLQVFPIVMMNTFTGMNNVETIKLELMQSMGATKLATVWHVVFLDSLPQVFNGLRLGTILATITAISTEVVSGNEGLGNNLMVAKSLLKMDLVLATVLCCALIGIFFYTLIQFIEHKIIKWTI